MGWDYTWPDLADECDSCEGDWDDYDYEGMYEEEE